MKLHDLLGPRERRVALLLLGMILVLGLMEMAGVGSIMPFVAVLTDPQIVETNRYLSTVYNWLAFATPQEFLFFLGIFVFAVALISTVFKAMTNWLTVRFIRQERFVLSIRLFATLSAPALRMVSRKAQLRSWKNCAIRSQ